MTPRRNGDGYRFARVLPSVRRGSGESRGREGGVDRSVRSVRSGGGAGALTRRRNIVGGGAVLKFKRKHGERENRSPPPGSYLSQFKPPGRKA